MKGAALTPEDAAIMGRLPIATQRSLAYQEKVDYYRLSGVMRSRLADAVLTAVFIYKVWVDLAEGDGSALWSVY